MSKFEVYRDSGGEFRFRLLANNGENILASEGYREKRSAFNGINSIKKNCLLPERFVIKHSENGKPYFVLKAANHEVIGVSQMYESEAGAQTGIASVTTVAPEAEVVDLTKRKKA